VRPLALNIAVWVLLAATVGIQLASGVLIGGKWRPSVRKHDRPFDFWLGIILQSILLAIISVMTILSWAGTVR